MNPVSTYSTPVPHATVKQTSSDLPIAYTQESRISWAAIFAGLAAAIALEALFMMLGSGLGFALYNPLSDNSTLTGLGAGAAVVQGLSAVVALWFGGWVSGRFAPVNYARGTGLLHGFSVWASATVAGMILVSVGAGVAMSGLSKVAGGGLSLAGQVTESAGDAATELSSVGLMQPTEIFKSFTEEVLPTQTGGQQIAGASIRGKREVSMAVVRFYNSYDTPTMNENRAALKAALVEYGAMNEQTAENTIQGWTRSYEKFKADVTAFKQNAEMKAREAAEKTAEVLAALSIAYFVAFAIGAIAACMGGAAGARYAQKYHPAVAVV